MLRLVAVCSLLAGFALFPVAPAAAQGLPAGADPQNTLVIDSTQGRIVIKLRNDIAPQHAARLKQLARDKFYEMCRSIGSSRGSWRRPAMARTATARAARNTPTLRRNS